MRAGLYAKLSITVGRQVAVSWDSLISLAGKKVNMADQKKRTLEDSDIVSNHAAEKEVSRRSMLGTVGSIALGGAASTVMAGCYRRAVVVGPRAPNAVVVGPQVQYQQQQWASGVTDSDGGPYADPAGNGRGAQRQVCSGITDSDGGPGADPGGCGRGRVGMTSGITDSDGGPYADPAGNGRGNVRQGYTGITDSDGGPYADPAGSGRGRWR